jgi:hypothetical protein
MVDYHFINSSTPFEEAKVTQCNAKDNKQNIFTNGKISYRFLSFPNWVYIKSFARFSS